MRPRLGMLMLGGFMGTLVVTTTTYLVSPMLIGPPVNFAAALARWLGDRWAAGLLAHFAIGTFVLPVLFGLFFYRWLWGSALVRALSWGAAIWLVTEAAILPMSGGGFFSLETGGFLGAIGSLVEHLLYGFALGLFGFGSGEEHGAGIRPAPAGARARQAC